MLLALLTVLALGIFQESVLLTGIKIHSEIVLSTVSSDDCGRCCHARFKLFPKEVKQKNPELLPSKQFLFDGFKSFCAIQEVKIGL